MNNRQKFELLALVSLQGKNCPSPDELAAYSVGVLTENEQLRVAAHVRQCLICQEDVRLTHPPAPRRRPLLAHLLPIFAEGVRSTSATHLVRQYRAADLTISLTIVPLVNDMWRLTGQLLRHEQPISAQQIVVRSGRKRGYHQSSDEYGFFSFEALPAGNYTLTVERDNTTVQIRALNLSHNDPSVME